nr:hypothetical protein BaRGS_029940 [Batillaria attramentaria]
MADGMDAWYIGIIHPIRAHILCNRRRIGLVVGLVWPVSILAGSPTFLFNRVQRGHPEVSVQYCMLSFPVDHDFYYLLFKFAEFGLFYVGPLVVQVVLYAIVSRQLFMGSEKLHRRLTVLDENGLAKERSSEALQARKGVVKMLIMSVIVYFISYSPQHVLLVYQTFRTAHFHDTWTVHVLVMIVAYVNSAANPILYSIFSQNFRQTALCAWRLKIRRRKKKQEPRRQSTFSTSSRFGRLASLVPSANTDL